jgi:hypothetical protein
MISIPDKSIGEQATFSDDERFEFSLLCRTLHNLRLYRMGTDQPENKYRLLLADTMRPILGLCVHLRILRGNTKMR